MACSDMMLAAWVEIEQDEVSGLAVAAVRSHTLAPPRIKLEPVPSISFIPGLPMISASGHLYMYQMPKICGDHDRH